MIKKINITDTTLRDAHQSHIATRLKTEDMLPICEKMDNVGFWSMEVWGGATFDTAMRFLREDPWERLKELKKALPNTKLQMLLRGQNLVGYKHYPDDIVWKFVEKSAENGIDIFRIFDALNDIRNVRSSIKAAKQFGKFVEGALSYTTSPVHTTEYFLDYAKALEDLGVDSICIKDMAGLIKPYEAYDLVGRLNESIKVPLHFHTHDTAGFATMSVLKAIEAGIDIVDTAISPFASGTSQAPTESIVAALKDTDYDTGLSLEILADIADYFREIKKKYTAFESEYTGINTKILLWQIPGGMLSNLASQLKEQNALDKINDVLDEVPAVRQDLGYPPLVTPTSQIVGSQATLNIISGERYKVITNEIKNYLKGLYGKPPGTINENLRKLAIGTEKVIDRRPADYLESEFIKLKAEIGNRAKSEEDVLSYALFPQVASEFFELREKGELKVLMPRFEAPQKEKEKKHIARFAPSEFNVKLHGEMYHIRIAGSGQRTENPRMFFVYVDGKLEEVIVEPLVEVVTSQEGELIPKAAIKTERPKATEVGDITTTIPGKVSSIKVKKGDTVVAGDAVMVIEAMKMESEVHTPIDGVVYEIYVNAGDTVNPGEALIRIR
ncbi:MAG: sodium-extruding oxaloacetate decarboxylase subunit alpha [Deltaproteobacteria bacterium]|nr:sodium-extruding oxaloacetate decarboxylase subunit alpha [Deltaproteobacteria bacterium]